MKYKTKKYIIRIFLSAVVGLLIIPINKSNADYESFLSKLRNIEVPVDKMIYEDGLSRYELTRLLNAVECKDCIVPSNDFVGKYKSDFWSNFKLAAGKNFNDIAYVGGERNGEKYYYCVAYVGENDYMNGYPINTSPVCAGKFCGGQDVNKAEFIQVIINLISNYIYEDISINRDKVKSWIETLDKDKYQYKTFDEKDIKTIYDNSKSCEKSCKLGNGSEVKTYLKYCMFNLTDCGMGPVGKIGQGYRPVAELNLLRNQNIVELDQEYWDNIGGRMDVEKIFEVIYNLNTKVDCEFNSDYDCDGVENTKDICPISYNPSQKDTDKDRVGDVCDDDIDGDGVKNPVGIVDESGKINIRLRMDNMDNCLFVSNTDQKDTDRNGVGDKCETINQNYLSMYIYVDEFTGSAPLEVSLKAITNGSYKDIVWKFSDGYTTRGDSVKHILSKPGVYSVSAIAKGDNNDAYASTTIIVGFDPTEVRGIGAISQKIGGKAPFETNLNVGYVGKYDWISRTFGDNEIVENQDRTFKKMFLEEGTHKVTIKAMKDDKIRGVSQFNLGVGDKNPGSILKTSILNPEIGKNIMVNTEYINLSNRDISYIEWNRGDGKIERNNYFSTNHTYDIEGQKVIIQRIVLKNGVIMTNMMTIFVVDKNMFKSNSIILNPTTLNNKVGSRIGFDIKTIGSKITSYINIIFQYAANLSDIISKNGGRISFTYDLVNRGIYHPSVKMNINQCNYLKADMTMYVKGYDLCTTKKINGELDKYKCDMDKDGIPDICDDDIDGDGVKNLLGLINYEKKDCTIDIFDLENKGNTFNQISMDILKKHFQGVCSLDNAPFDVNKTQEDLNIDGIGDVMNTKSDGNEEKISIFIGDSDGDGIPDYKDKCMLIQETYNGINDSDGCPEIGSDVSCTDTNSCGDGIINENETCDNCPADIGFCDNLLDDGDEDSSDEDDEDSSDEDDEDGGDNGTGNYEGTGYFCGDKIISNNEFCWNCPIDVGSCISKCGNGLADLGETCTNCPSDIKQCGKCGNKIKDPDESCSSCPEDYGVCSELEKCGNGIIDPGETCNNCPTDVRRCYFPYGDFCGDKIISSNESCWNCPIDVGSCISDDEEISDDISCGNGKIESGESCISCPIDIGDCEEDIKISIEECLQCPCPYTSSDGDIKNGNKVRSILWSQKMIIPYIKSAQWIVDF